MTQFKWQKPDNQSKITNHCYHWRRERAKPKRDKTWLTRPLSKFLSQVMSSMSSSSRPLREDLDPRSMESVCNRGRVGSKAGLTTPNPGPWYSVLLPDMADGDSVCHTTQPCLHWATNRGNQSHLSLFWSFCFLYIPFPPHKTTHNWHFLWVIPVPFYLCIFSFFGDIWLDVFKQMFVINVNIIHCCLLLFPLVLFSFLEATHCTEINLLLTIPVHHPKLPRTRSRNW